MLYYKKRKCGLISRVYLNENQDNLHDEHAHYVDFLTRRHHVDFLTRPQYCVDFHYNQEPVSMRFVIKRNVRKFYGILDIYTGM